MNKPNGSPDPNIKHRLPEAAGNIIRGGLAAAALAGIVAPTAEAVSASRLTKLEQRVNEQITAQQVGLTTYNGKLVIREKVQGGVIDLNIKNPVVVDTTRQANASPRGIGPKSDEIAYGFISRDNDQPDVVLIPGNSKNLTITRASGSQTAYQTNVFFSSDGAGGFNWNEPYTSLDGKPFHGGPVLNAQGKPEEIALPSITVVSGDPQVSL